MQQLENTTLRSLLVQREPLLVAGVVFLAHVALRAAGRILIGAFNDDGAYVALGQALAGGIGYRLIYLVGDPVAVKYPPGLPLLIAVPWKLFGTLPIVRATIGLLNPLASGAAAGMIWWIGRRKLGAAPAVLALCAIGPFFLDAVIQYFNIPLSEPYFVCGWATALLLAYRMADAPPGAARPSLAVALGLVLALTVLFRTAGLVVLAAVLAALARERRPWRDVAVCAGVALVPLAVWHVVHAAVIARGPLSPLPDETPYWRWLPLDRPAQLLSYSARVLGNNSLGYLRYLSGYLARSHFVGPTLAAAFAVAALAGGARAWRAHTALVATVAAVLATVLLWPYAQGRLLLPILPFAGLLAASTLQLGVTRGSVMSRRLAYALLGVVALTAAVRQVALRRAAEAALASGAPPPPENRSPLYVLAGNSRYIFGVVSWVRANTTSQDRIMVDAPAAVYLYTGRKTAAAAPAEPAFTASVFQVPGRYLATRILEDSLTIIVLGIAGSGLDQDIRAVASRCPRVLQRQSDAAGALPAFYRVVRDDNCLRERVLSPTRE